MLNKTALKNPSFLAKVGYAMRGAVNASVNRLNIGLATATNRHGAPAVRVVYRRGLSAPFEFFDSSDRDVTDEVIQALRQYGSPEAAQ
ncbi:hypothetical protein NAV33_07415 [Pseudomonas stutzeri]|uniref:hypothetical protein n=1 Tax=Stutzerimonas stutzeri TaxID=316 RepID=UPI00210E1674|nr:hypothetical protein [Stutzerimonas stutzeri]MCQ4311723.1 hypothetical protein [Stutzerimonas stutzeri]